MRNEEKDKREEKALIDRKHLIALRKKTKLSQKKFSELVNIPVRTLRAYEGGQRALSFSKFFEIRSALGYLNDKKNLLEVKIDYLRVTFKEVKDLDFFCQRYLYCPLSDFVSGETRLMQYEMLYRRGDIWIFAYFSPENPQITLQLSGQGCRQMELILEKNQLTWFDLFQKMYFERSDMSVTRLDIAMDELFTGDESKQFFLSDLISKVYKKEVDLTRIKNWNYIGGGDLNFKDEKESANRSQGISIYFGSRQSNLYFNFYEKRYELAKKENISVSDSLAIFNIWNRYELRLSHEKAQSVMEEYLSGIDLAEIAQGLINYHIHVYDTTNSYGAFLPDAKWENLFGGAEPLRLSVSPEPYSIERTIKWLIYQVSDSLALVNEADRKLCTEYLKLILEVGKVSDRGEKILENLTIAQKDVIESAIYS